MKKWIFRLLVTLFVIGGLALFGLKILSGTSDKQKRGLEQAFSEIFHGTAKFGELKAFNLFPQFKIDVNDLEISGIEVTGLINAAKVEIGFGPNDLLLKNRKIEIFHLKDLKLSEGLYTPLAIEFSDAGIYAGTEKGTGKFSFSGRYGTKDLNGQIDMGMEESSRPKFFFHDENNLVVTLGAVQLNAVFSPYTKTGPEVKQIKISGEGQKIKMECELPAATALPFQQFMKDVIGKVAEVKTTDDLKKLCNSLKL